MDNNLKALTKFACFVLATSSIMYVLFPFLYQNTYELIDRIDPAIYDKYATDDKFEENVFFTEEIDANTGILRQLHDEIKDLSAVSRIQDYAYIIVQNQDIVEEIIAENQEYRAYLLSIDSSVNDLFEWSAKIADLDNKISIGCLYVAFLFISFIMVVAFGYRKTFYVSAAITYLIAVLSMLTGGISDFLTADIVSLILKSSPGIFTYGTMKEWHFIFGQAFKESTLTFIIFDTVVQIFQNSRNERAERSCRYIYSSLEIQISYLKRYQDLPDAYRAKMMLPIDEVVNLCREKAKKLQRAMRNGRLPDARKKALSAEYENYADLEKMLLFLRYNDEEHTTREYISCFHRVRRLMYKCGFGTK